MLALCRASAETRYARARSSMAVWALANMHAPDMTLASREDVVIPRCIRPQSAAQFREVGKGTIEATVEAPQWGDLAPDHAAIFA